MAVGPAETMVPLGRELTVVDGSCGVAEGPLETMVPRFPGQGVTSGCGVAAGPIELPHRREDGSEAQNDCAPRSHTLDALKGSADWKRRFKHVAALSLSSQLSSSKFGLREAAQIVNLCTLRISGWCEE